MPLGHIGINVPDLTTAKAYYDGVMPLLGYEEFLHAHDQFSYRPIAGKVGTFVFFYPAQHHGNYDRQAPGLQHLAFMVATREAVHAVHNYVSGRGDEVLYPPQEFPEYHPGYYATFWVDPFGVMLEAVCHRGDRPVVVAV